MKICLISAVNDETVLQQCLLRSPNLQTRDTVELLFQRGFTTAAAAYNDAITQAKGEVLIFLHQDMYLPAGWLQGVRTAMEQLNVTDPNWGVLGVYGVTAAGQARGHLYCNANQYALGAAIHEPVEVATLDEVVLIIRRDSGLRFDPGLPGFHLYGTDLCLIAQQQGFKNYVVPGFCVHNANGYGLFPRSFWQGYFYLRRKWKSQLPIRTPCVEISKSLWPLLRSTAWRFCWLKAKRIKLARRVDDPAKLHQRLITS